MATNFLFKCTFKYRLHSVSIWTSLKFCRLVMGYFSYIAASRDLIILLAWWPVKIKIRPCKRNHLIFDLSCPLCKDILKKINLRFAIIRGLILDQRLKIRGNDSNWLYNESSSMLVSGQSI